MNSSSSSEVSKNALYDALCSNLDRDLTELYILCEYDSNEQWVGTCLSLLNEASNTFLEVSLYSLFPINTLNNIANISILFNFFTLFHSFNSV
jgi:hypothetical protein